MKELSKVLAHKAKQKHGGKVFKLARLYMQIESGFTTLSVLGLAIQDLENPDRVGYGLFGKFPDHLYQQYQKAYCRSLRNQKNINPKLP